MYVLPSLNIKNVYHLKYPVFSNFICYMIMHANITVCKPTEPIPSESIPPSPIPRDETKDPKYGNYIMLYVHVCGYMCN